MSLVQFCVFHPSTWLATSYTQDVAFLIAKIEFIYVELGMTNADKQTNLLFLSLAFVLMVLQTPHLRLTELLSNRDWIDRR